MLPSRPRASHFILPAILVLAAAFRLYRLLDFPPGFHFDEAIDLKIALDVLGGARPLYVAEGWGREALYYYLVAPLLRLIDYNPLALRATAALCGLGVIVAAYALARRWHGQWVAWLTAAWLAVAMWPVWAARFGVRHISLALMLGLAAWAFWRAFTKRTTDDGRQTTAGAEPPHPQAAGRWGTTDDGPQTTAGVSSVVRRPSSVVRYAAAGALLGLTAYTYQPARFVPLLFGGFGLYLLLFHRRPAAGGRAWRNRRGWLVWGASAALVALPLALILTRATPIETGERAFSIEPLTDLLAGHPRSVLDNLVATAGVFTVRGDPLKSYNLPGRPLFVPRWTGLFFYAGLALAIWRWRRPPYAFVLLWLVVALLPTVVTISAPNFNRMVAAQFPVFFLAALGAAEIAGWASSRARWAGVVAALVIAIALALTATATARDLFHVWPEQFADAHPLNREIAAVARYLEHDADGRPVVISSRDIEDEDPYVVAVSLDRAIDRRWVDSSQALALPAGAQEAWLIVTADRWIDPLLADLVRPDRSAADLSGLHYANTMFSLHLLSAANWPSLPTPGLTLPPEAGGADAPPYPIPFCDCAPGAAVEPAVWLTGVEVGGMPSPNPSQGEGDTDNPSHGEGDTELTLLTTWETAGARFLSLAMFVHLLDAGGAIVAQDDGLGYPPHTWQPGDRFIQLARLPLPADLPPGDYTLQFGLYDRADGRRWPVLVDGAPAADRVLVEVGD